MKEKSEFNYSTLIETIFAVVIGQNAIMISKPILLYLTKFISFVPFISLFSIGVVNLLTLIANWMSSKKTESYYNKTLFLEDIGALAVFAIFTQVISNSFTNDGLLLDINSWLLVFSISYLLIYFSFVLWNIATLPNGNMHEKVIATISIKMNLIVIIFLILLLGAIVWDLSCKIIVFAFNIILQILVLIYYFGAMLELDNICNDIKIKATWINSRHRVYKQLMVSFFSYIIRPFVCEKRNGIKTYWVKYHSGIINDNLVFDGENFNYFEKVRHIISDIGTTNSKFIVDLCSGNGTFYKWLVNNNIEFSGYIGLDFAIDNANLASNAFLVKKNILETTFHCDKDTIVFICNGLCYLKKDELKRLLKKIDSAGMVIVIEPVPGLFWDATFSGIILNYRTRRTLKKYFFQHHYDLKKCVTDYLQKIGNLHFFALSRAYIFIKSSK